MCVCVCVCVCACVCVCRACVYVALTVPFVPVSCFCIHVLKNEAAEHHLKTSLHHPQKFPEESLYLLPKRPVAERKKDLLQTRTPSFAALVYLTARL